jgi:hypothetical protein
MVLTADEIRETLKELVNAYTEFRDKWIQTFGNADGFDKWFTEQVTKREVK